MTVSQSYIWTLNATEVSVKSVEINHRGGFRVSLLGISKQVSHSSSTDIRMISIETLKVCHTEHEILSFTGVSVSTSYSRVGEGEFAMEGVGLEVDRSELNVPFDVTSMVYASTYLVTASFRCASI